MEQKTNENKKNTFIENKEKYKDQFISFKKLDPNDPRRQPAYKEQKTIRKIALKDFDILFRKRMAEEFSYIDKKTEELVVPRPVAMIDAVRIRKAFFKTLDEIVEEMPLMKKVNFGEVVSVQKVPAFITNKETKELETIAKLKFKIIPKKGVREKRYLTLQEEEKFKDYLAFNRAKAEEAIEKRREIAKKQKEKKTSSEQNN